MSEILWKAGEEYRTRDGSRARVYATDGAAPLVIHGAIFLGGEWYTRQWRADGKWPPCEEHANDLMPPKRVVWANVYRAPSGTGLCTGAGHLYETRAQADFYQIPDRIACVPIEYPPGQFDE